jgi:hypothetical protein
MQPLGPSVLNLTCTSTRRAWARSSRTLQGLSLGRAFLSAALQGLIILPLPPHYKGRLRVAHGRVVMKLTCCLRGCVQPHLPAMTCVQDSLSVSLGQLMNEWACSLHSHRVQHVIDCVVCRLYRPCR